MYIRGISINIPHPYHEGIRDIDAHQVCPPDDWQAYAQQILTALQDDQGIQISIGSTASRGSIAIAIGGMQTVESVNAVQENHEALLFVVGLATLRQLRAALDVAIVTAE